MTGSDPEKRNRRALRQATALLPIAESVNADAHRLCEASLREPDEPAKRSDVFTRLELPSHQTSSDSRRDCPGELLGGELGNVSHRLSSTKDW